MQGWDEVDGFVDTVWRYQEEVDAAGRTVYGGVAEGDQEGGLLLGGTAYYLGPDLRPLLTGVISIGSSHSHLQRGSFSSCLQHLRISKQVVYPAFCVDPRY